MTAQIEHEHDREAVASGSLAILLGFPLAIFFVVGGLYYADLVRPQAALVSLPADTGYENVRITLEQDGIVYPLVQAKDTESGYVLAEPLNLKEHYLLSASLNDGGKYRDIAIQVDAADSNMVFTLGGFPSASPLEITQNDKIVLTGLHTDWAGKIEFSYRIPEGARGTVCINTSESFVLCHTPERPHG